MYIAAKRSSKNALASRKGGGPLPGGHLCRISPAMEMHSSMCSSLMTVRSSANSRSVTMPVLHSNRNASRREPVAWR